MNLTTLLWIPLDLFPFYSKPCMFCWVGCKSICICSVVSCILALSYRNACSRSHLRAGIPACQRHLPPNSFDRHHHHNVRTTHAPEFRLIPRSSLNIKGRMTVRTKVLLPLRGRAVARSFSVSRPRWEAAPLPPRKPVGAFRGGYGFVI